MSPVAARREGAGPPVVLVHGGLGPEVTWALQEPLTERWELIIPWRRGFAPSPKSERIDFEQDAEDIGELLGEGAHLAGFSYGGLGAAVAAGHWPQRVRSLTLIEAPLFGVARGNPDVEAMVSLSEEFIAGAEDPARREAFLEIAGVDAPGGTGAPALAQVERQIGRLRTPLEATPDLDAIAARVPALVVSGAHQAGIEAVCDALAERLGAERLRLAGAGHAAHRAGAFNARFEAFLAAAETNATGS